MGVQTRLIEYLIKFECSAWMNPFNQKVCFHCFSSTQSTHLSEVGLAFAKHMVKFNDMTTDLKNVVFLRETLNKILVQTDIFSEARRS